MKTVTVTTDEVQKAFETAVKEHAPEHQAMGLFGFDIGSGTISKTFCEAWGEIRKVVKKELAGNWMAMIAFRVLESVVLSKICPAAADAPSVETGGKKG